jgi:hypothetical protein
MTAQQAVLWPHSTKFKQPWEVTVSRLHKINSGLSPPCRLSILNHVPSFSPLYRSYAIKVLYSVTSLFICLDCKFVNAGCWSSHMNSVKMQVTKARKYQHDSRWKSDFSFQDIRRHYTRSPTDQLHHLKNRHKNVHFIFSLHLLKIFICSSKY